VLIIPNQNPVAFTSLQIKNRFKIIEMIDSGGFGSIYTATDMKDNSEVVVKLVSLMLIIFRMEAKH